MLLNRRQFLQQSLVTLGAAALASTARASSAPPQKIYNLSQFAIVGDGQSDCSAGLQQLFAELESRGGRVYFPPGDYLVKQPLCLQVKQDINLCGKQARFVTHTPADEFAVSFSGDKRLLGNLAGALRRGSRELTGIAKSPSNSSSVLLIAEGNQPFVRIRLQFNQVSQFKLLCCSVQRFFTPQMVGKNLINSQNCATYYIIKLIDDYSAEVVAGNNQSAGLDLSRVNEWALIELWSGARDYYVKGEFIQLAASASSGKYLLKQALLDNYALGISSCWEISSGRLTLDGLSFSGVGGGYGVELKHLLNPRLSELNINGFSQNGLSIRESLGIELAQLNVQTAITNRASNYATLIASCQNLQIKNSVFSGGFHALSHGGSFPCRQINLTRVTTQASKNWSLDFHGNCEQVALEQVNCLNGAYIGAANVTINASSFSIADHNLGALVLAPERNNASYQLSNCRINNRSGNALVLANQFCVTTINLLRATNCVISAANLNGIYLQPYPYGPNPTLAQLTLSQNKISAGNWKFISVQNHNKFNILTEKR